ncbi:MAG TPA: hypothetical protein VM074_05710 [Solimonas sp.]|nr:hypothetical protein [Solimonas sp.]
MVTLRQFYLDRLLGGVALIALHEASSIQGHLQSAGERLRLAREARNVSELVREQIDLLPEERNRLRGDQEVRRALWRGLLVDLKPARGRSRARKPARSRSRRG